VDPVQHKASTGVSNRVILENLKRSPIWQADDSPSAPDPRSHRFTGESAGVADLLCSLRSVERVDLLPVHEYGKGKYDELGKQYTLVAEPISQERQQEIKALFEECGCGPASGDRLSTSSPA